MKRRSFANLLAICFVMMLGVYFGYANTPDHYKTEQPPPIKLVDISKEVFTLPNIIDIDLNKEEVSISSNAKNTTVNIQKEKEIIKVPKYIKEEIPVYVYKLDLIQSTKLFKDLAPLNLPKITVNRN